MKKISKLFVLIFMCGIFSVNYSEAQVTVTNPGNTGPSALSATYTSLAAAITDLNSKTSVTGPLIITLDPGNPQTTPFGGYSITAILAGASEINRVTFEGSSNTITAYTPQPLTSAHDAIFKIIGADFITIQNFTMEENPGNTIFHSNNMTEWGVALLHSSLTNGAQNNTIANNNISLNRAYGNSFGIYSNNRHSATIVNEDITNNTTGPNSNNKVYGNTISNVNMGITFIGCNTAANQDVGNSVGNFGLMTGNNFSNWGGAEAISGYISNSQTSYCIFMNHQTADTVCYNTITSAVVSGLAVTFRGILKDYTSNAPAGNFTSVISNNTITLKSAFTSGIFECIRSQGMTALSTAAIKIENNTITDCAISGAASSSSMVCIVNSSAPGTLSMINNIIQNNVSSATTGGFTGISNTGAVVNSAVISNNQIGNITGGAITFSDATSGTVLCAGSTGAAAACLLTINNNNVQGIVHAISGTSTHTYISWNHSNSVADNINGNTFNNLDVNTSGSVTFLNRGTNSMTSTGSISISNNQIITGFNKGTAGGMVSFFSNGGGGSSSPAGSTILANLNNFSNVTVTGSTNLICWYDNDGLVGGGVSKIITNNTISDITGGIGFLTGISTNFSGPGSVISDNTITNITLAGSNLIGIIIGSGCGQGTHTCENNTIKNLTNMGYISAIQGGSSSIVTLNVNNNHMDSFSSTGGGSQVSGIILNAGTTNNVFKNKISNLISNNSGGVNGMLFTDGITTNIYNNLIGNLRTPTSPLNSVRGINITSTTAASNFNISFNTIYIQPQTSTGFNFSPSGVFHTASTVSTTAQLNMRNNIIVNLANPSGAGNSAAFRRTDGTSGNLANYSSTSDNNLFYTGTPDAGHLIYSDGVSNAQSINAYKTGVFTAGTISPRDGASVSENPNFLSTTGSSPDFLHINSAIPSQIGSGGINIPGITDDFDGDTRNSTTPDIGADEFGQTLNLKISFQAYPGTDTIRVLLRNSTAPYEIVDSVTGLGGGSIAQIINFNFAVSSIPYYVVVRNRNAIETWSSGTLSFTGNSASYDFTTSLSQAYLNNQIIPATGPQTGIPSVYQGDVNQNGSVNLEDIILVKNDATNFLTGPYLITDFNGSGNINLEDILITSNNNSSFISRKRP